MERVTLPRFRLSTVFPSPSTFFHVYLSGKNCHGLAGSSNRSRYLSFPFSVPTLIRHPPSIDWSSMHTVKFQLRTAKFPSRLLPLPQKYVSLFSFSKFSRAIEEANGGKILEKYSRLIEVQIRLRIRLEQILLSLSPKTVIKTSRFFLIFRLIELARRKINRVPSFHGRASGYLKHRW